MNLERALEILQNMNSVCPSCKGKGLIVKGGQTLVCECCGGKGYKTFEELEDEVKETKAESKRRRRKRD